MASVSEHYERHLAPVYAWMLGGPEQAFARGAAELRGLGIERGECRLAVDLGAGFGLHAVPLAQLGYSVLAIDRCRLLLQQLGQHAAGSPVQLVEADLGGFGAHLPRKADLILCMGDTLPHLPSLDAVRGLLREIAEGLAPGGRLVATFRDYCRTPLAGDARFIPVRSTATLILTCFVEYFADHVQVHDLLQQLVDGVWQLKVSSYPKLRLDPQWLVSQLAELGLEAQQGVSAGGMILVTATNGGCNSG